MNDRDLLLTLILYVVVRVADFMFRYICVGSSFMLFSQ